MLAAGLHNALFLVHPRADVWSVSDRQRRRIIDNALTLVSQPLTRDRKRVMARHGLLHHLFHLSRRDTTVSWWTGRARFQGQVPSKRLIAWKNMRRVREEHVDVGFDELFAVPDTAAIVATLLRRTPLTQLLDSQPGAPPLHWEDAVFVLRDTELARAVRSASRARRRAGRSGTRAVAPRRGVRADARARARRGRRPRGRRVPRPHLRAVRARRDPHARAQREVAVGLDRARGRSRGAAPARPARRCSRCRARSRSSIRGSRFHRASPAFRRSPQRWRVHRAQTAELLSEPVIDALAQRLRRHLRPAQALAI